ncbi:MAG: hypothetical protein ACE5GO_09565 [Anaerolineales bacterium]
MSSQAPSIGTLAEKSLHAALKTWYAQPGDQLETRLDGFVIDIIRDDLLIEIQTRSFSALKRKFEKLLGGGRRLHLVHPIPTQKWIVRQTGRGTPIGRRKSPKKGRAIDLFHELIRIPHIVPHPNFSFEVILTHQDEIWRDDGRGSWRRRRWSVYDHRLLDVVGQIRFDTPADYLSLLPEGLSQPFTNRELAAALSCRVSLAQKMTYTLRKMVQIEQIDKRGNAHLFSVSC